MINDFRPYMTDENVEKFQGYMAEIDAAEAELETELPPLLDGRADVTAAEFTSIARFDDAWPGIEADMSDDLLVRMEQMVPNFEAVDALPPFPLFPWFFVAPRPARRRGRRHRAVEGAAGTVTTVVRRRPGGIGPGGQCSRPPSSRCSRGRPRAPR